MAELDARSVPVDASSSEKLKAAGLLYRTVDMSDAADGEGFLRADSRGFLDGDPNADLLEEMREAMAERRNVGVYDQSTPLPWPIGTVNSWVTPLTLPGAEIPMWAISSVTVAGTHRRRGIARALLEGELRAAASAGVAVAGLTVSEATIYSRYGFGSALPVAKVTLDTTRAGWVGATAPGRVEYIDRETLATVLGEQHEVARTQRSGQVAGWTGRWSRAAGLSVSDKNGAEVRGVRYVDEAGATTGAMAYRLSEMPGTFRFELKISMLVTTSADALRGLWQFAVQHDLVSRVSADLRPIDDPIMWLVADQRAVEFTVHDHGWLRILDVPAALTARTYRAQLDTVIGVEDTLGFAAGRWRLQVDERGAATVTMTDAAPDVTLGAVELAAIYAGGVAASRLVAAGRIEADAGIAASIDDAFRTADAPLLGIWY